MGVSVVLTLEIRQQGGLSLEIHQNGWTRIEKHCETRAEPGRAQKSIEIKKTLNLGGPAGPKIEDWSSIGAWKATGKSSQYAGGYGA